MLNLKEGLEGGGQEGTFTRGSGRDDDNEADEDEDEDDDDDDEIGRAHV